MKKIVFKKWVVVVLVIINVLAIMFAGSECDDLKMSILVRFIALGIFVLNSCLLLKFNRKELV